MNSVLQQSIVYYKYSQEQDFKTPKTEYVRLLRVVILSVKYSMPDVGQSSINRLWWMVKVYQPKILYVLS